MPNNVEVQDLRNLITSVNLAKALVKKFETKPFTVGSANSSVKMFSSLVVLFEPALEKLSMKDESLISSGLGKRVILAKMNKNFNDSFVNSNEDEVLPNAIVSETLISYKKLLESLQVMVALFSAELPNDISSLSEREIAVIDECREAYNQFMKKYHEIGEAFHNAEHLQDSTTFEKELAIVQNADISLGVSKDSATDSSSPQISANFRVRD